MKTPALVPFNPDTPHDLRQIHREYGFTHARRHRCKYASFQIPGWATLRTVYLCPENLKTFSGENLVAIYS